MNVVKVLCGVALFFGISAAHAEHIEYHGTDPDQNADADIDFKNHKFYVGAGSKRGCAGEVESESAGVNWKDNSFFVVSSDNECVITFHPQGKRNSKGKQLYTVTESSGCGIEHGAGCGFQLPGVWY